MSYPYRICSECCDLGLNPFHDNKGAKCPLGHGWMPTDSIPERFAVRWILAGFNDALIASEYGGTETEEGVFRRQLKTGPYFVDLVYFEQDGRTTAIELNGIWKLSREIENDKKEIRDRFLYDTFDEIIHVELVEDEDELKDIAYKLGWDLAQKDRIRF